LLCGCLIFVSFARRPDRIRNLSNGAGASS
jgi:hypothetical protein